MLEDHSAPRAMGYGFGPRGSRITPQIIQLTREFVSRLTNDVGAMMRLPGAIGGDGFRFDGSMIR